MQRTKIVIGYQHTHNLGNYSNARPNIIIEAALDESDDPEAVKAQLKAEARAYVHEAIDEALEAEGQRAHFSTAPRFRLWATQDTVFGDWRDRRTVAPPERLLVIVPMDVRLHDGRSPHTWWSNVDTKVRIGHAHRIAADFLRDRDGYSLLDLSDGDLSMLPLWAWEAPVDPGPPPAPPITAKRTEDGEDWADPSDDDEGDDDEWEAELGDRVDAGQG